MWLTNPQTEVSTPIPSSVGHHTAHSPQPSPIARDSHAVLVGFSSVNALPIRYQPTPTLNRACHASPVNETERGNGFVGSPYIVSTTTPSPTQP